MRTISSNLAKQTFGRVLDVAQREPVIVNKHNHPTAVILSMAEYDRLKLREPVKSSVPAPKRKGGPKSLPVIGTKAGSLQKRFTSQEMVELVNDVANEPDA